MFQIELAAPAVVRWLVHARPVRVLHSNAEMLTLVDQAGEVCSLVSATRGLGPFAGVVEGGEWGVGKRDAGERGFGEVRAGQLWFGEWCFEASNAIPWDPRVRWRGVPPVPADFAPVGPEPPLAEAASALIAGVQSNDWPATLGAAHYLAGRGPGLTPLGDDLILGVLLALHVLCHPWATKAQGLAEHVTPRTTTLSAEWIHAAGRGEAAIPWHQLAHARSPRAAAAAIHSIRRWGSTSGEAACWAFGRAVGAREAA